MTETLGSSTDMPDQGGFSFVDTAEELANDLIQSLVVDVQVDLDFVFGLDLNPIFNSSAIGILDRIPHPFIQINQFDISGVIGVNDWTSNFDFSGLDFAIAGAKAGRQFGELNKNTDQIKLINDYSWLKKKYNEDFA